MDKTQGLRAPGLLDRHPLAVPAALYLVAAALGLLVLAESRTNPFFANLISDEPYYLRWAADLAAGRGFGPRPFFISPLYLFFLALLAKVSITAPAAIRTVQVLLGSLVYPLVYALGRRLFGPAAGLAAALLALGYGTLLFLPVDLAPPWLEALLLVLIALSVAKEPSPGRLGVAGLAGGLLALSRPTILLFALLLPAALFVKTSAAGPGRWRPARLAAVFLGSFLLPVLPVTIRNAVVGRDFVLTSSHGGINFYIGNSPGAPGRLYAPEGLEAGLESLNDTDARRVAEAAAGRPLAPSAVSRYWFGRGLRFLAEQPVAAAALYARKMFLFLHAYEVSTNSDFYLFRERSAVLGLLRLPFTLFLALGGIGLWLARDRLRELLPLTLLVALQLLTPIVFFAAFRFRAPLAPLLALPAGHALVEMVRRTGRSRRGLRTALAAALAAVLLLSYPYPLVRDMDLDSRASFSENLGIHLVRERRTAAAEQAFREAVALRPGIQASHWYLAQILEGRGDFAGAAGEWRIAAELFGPGSTWGREAARHYERLRSSPGRR